MWRRRRLWLRWSWRDLRDRWIHVLAIAAVIAIGTGFYAGLGSLERWRIASNDASFEALDAHDLEIELPEGGLAPAGSLAAAARSIPAAGRFRAVQERLIAPTLIELARPGRDPLLVSGEIVGSQLGPYGPRVDGIAASRGRGLRAGDSGKRVAVIESNFGEFHELPPSGTLRLAGGEALTYVGQGRSPEYFLVSRPGGGDFGGAEVSFAVLFTSLGTAMVVSGERGVNDAVITLRDGTDRDAVQAQLERALAARSLGAKVSSIEDELARRVLYRDAEGDQRVFSIFAYLILAGAAFAAFNLSNRIVESQRREIGIGMALGVPPRTLAARPLLFGAQVALMGMLFGLALGLLSGQIFRGALEDLLPLPEMRTPFEPQVFVRGAVVGLLLPLLATALPVWRGVRLAPIEAIRVGFRSAKSSGLARFGKRLHLPGSALGQMPARNVLRAPRRTLLTALGVAAVITVMIAFSGMIDSFYATIDRSESEVAGQSPDRERVALDGFHPTHSGLVARITATPGVAATEPRLELPGSLASEREEFDAIARLIAPDSRVWLPSVTEGSRLSPGAPGILISEKAAEDLEVGVGDRIELTHPQRVGPEAVRQARSGYVVTGLHSDPFRNFAYLDAGQAGSMGLAGATNELSVLPAPGTSEEELKRSLFAVPGVAGVERATAGAEFVRERMRDFVGILRVVELFALLLALLIAFNSTSISADERSRENATMMAFGVPARRAVTIAVAESMLIGALGTVAGIALGVGILNWVLDVTLPETLPDLGVAAALSEASVLAACAVGILGVGLAPLLTARRIRRMDVPSALRVVE